jgi:uncharacterized repeat protein (TIGR03803 family)
VTAVVVVVPRPIGAQTPTLTVLHDFDKLDGSYPTNGLLLASDGNFYGTTPTGGPGTFDGADYGIVFRITPTGAFTNLVNFTSDNGTNPYAPPIEGSDGNLYGTTAGGGPLGPTRNGTVFKMTKAGALTTLLEFPYDPTTDTWTTMATAGAPAGSYAALNWTGKKVLVLAKLDGTSVAGQVVFEGGQFDPATNSWSWRARRPTPCSSCRRPASCSSIANTTSWARRPRLRPSC